MRFGRRIGLSFLLLSFLTVATGAVGLLFIYRVLGAFGGVPGVTEASAGGLAELDRTMKEAVDISQAIAGNDKVADVLTQRREFVRTIEEFDRSFARIRRGLEDDLYLDRLEQVKAEQSLLAEQTHALIDAMVAELQAEDDYRRRLTESEALWQTVVDATGAATQELEDAGTAPSGQLVSSLRSVARLQQDLFRTRVELRRYLALTDTDALPASLERLRELGGQVVRSATILESAEAPENAAEAMARSARAARGWQAGLFDEQGPLAAYQRALDLQAVTDEYTGAIREKANESLASLDSVVALGARLSAQADERGFVTAAPTLLVGALALATALSLVLSIALSKAITRPVKELITAAEAVRAGDYTPRLASGGADEMATLREAFNRMVHEIQRSHEEVTTLNTGLEQRIGERTTELRDEISRRQAVEDQLRQSEARYRALLRNFPAGILALVDTTGRVLAVGGSGLGRLGTTAQAVVGRAAADLIPEALLAGYRDRLREAFRGNRQALETVAGGLEWSVLLVPTPAIDGAPDTVTVLALDVTEAKEAERESRRRQRQLIEADRLASLGVLAAGVGHEINNPNQAVLLTGELLRRSWPDIRRVLDLHRSRGEDFLVGGLSYDAARQGIEEQFQGIVESARRVDAIVQSLREFARHDREDHTQPVNLNLVLRSALVLLGNLIRRTTDHLVLDLAPDLPLLSGNPQRIEQVIINIVQNACQALTDRSQSVTIRTQVEGEAVVLSVGDAGRGIDAADLPRVRDPFFTTKREQGGTGLGLSVTSTILAEHGGELEIRSEPGAGTTVVARFPTTAGRMR